MPITLKILPDLSVIKVFGDNKIVVVRGVINLNFTIVERPVLSIDIISQSSGDIKTEEKCCPYFFSSACLPTNFEANVSAALTISSIEDREEVARAAASTVAVSTFSNLAWI